MTNVLSKPWRAIALVASVAALAVAGVSYASIPDSNGVIHGSTARAERARPAVRR